MIIEHPWALSLLFLTLLTWIPVGRTTTRVASLKSWNGREPKRVRYLVWLKTFRFLAAIGLILALARPKAGVAVEEEKMQGLAIHLLVDISSSMDMSLALPDGKSETRMEVSKTILQKFVLGDGNKLTGRPNDLIGLIVFARYADTLSPLTRDHQALGDLIEHIQIQTRQNEDGTAYGDALSLAAARLERLDELKQNGEEQEIASRIIVLLTDGENNCGRHMPLESAALAKEWGIRIYTISLVDKDAENEEDTQAEANLRRIAEETGGVYRKTSSYDSLVGVYEEIDRLEKSEMVIQSTPVYADIFWIPALFSLICLFIEWVLRTTFLRSIG